MILASKPDKYIVDYSALLRNKFKILMDQKLKFKLKSIIESNHRILSSVS